MIATVKWMIYHSEPNRSPLPPHELKPELIEGIGFFEDPPFDEFMLLALGFKFDCVEVVKRVSVDYLWKNIDYILALAHANNAIKCLEYLFSLHPTDKQFTYKLHGRILDERLNKCLSKYQHIKIETVESLLDRYLSLSEEFKDQPIEKILPKCELDDKSSSSSSTSLRILLYYGRMKNLSLEDIKRILDVIAGKQSSPPIQRHLSVHQLIQYFIIIDQLEMIKILLPFIKKEIKEHDRFFSPLCSWRTLDLLVKNECGSFLLEDLKRLEPSTMCKLLATGLTPNDIAVDYGSKFAHKLAMEKIMHLSKKLMDQSICVSLKEMNKVREIFHGE